MLSVRTVLEEFYAWEWVAILLDRLVVGLLFFLSGRGKVFVPERREQMRKTLIEARVPLANFNTVFVSLVEFIFGLFLILGFATPLACVMLGGVMIVGIATTAARNIKASSLLEWLSEFVYLPEVLCLVILVWIFLAGAGWFSIDHFLLFRIQS